MSQTTHIAAISGDIEMDKGLEFLGFTDLEAELLGPDGQRKAQESISILLDLENRLEKLQATGLTTEDYQTVLAVRKAVKNAGRIVAAPHQTRKR